MTFRDDGLVRSGQVELHKSMLGFSNMNTVGIDGITPKVIFS